MGYCSSSLFMLLLLVVLAAVARNAHGHGMLLDPPARSSIWRLFPSVGESYKNYDDNAINCGGAGVYVQA